MLLNGVFSQADFEFDWDHGNTTKSQQKHGIGTDRAEEIFRNRDFLVPLGIQVEPKANEPRFVAELKKEAEARGIPYQILMRMFIIEGFQRLKKAG
ncbi:MAG: hypothetical protein HYW49_04705 [Deltaproteobacteria bacterium]|nr:hypothetical protein [Deltaproteobacteria bacterium]